MDDQYTENPIRILKGLEPVRLRPGMYIGDTDTTGYHHMAFEVIDNAVQEAKAGFCSNITVTLCNERTISVEDNGRGISSEIDSLEQRPILEVEINTLYAGFRPSNGEYIVAGGLHGVGLSVVNALSESFNVETHHDGYRYQIECSKGEILKPLEKLGATQRHGTTIIITPDREIFGDTLTFSPEILRSYLHRFAYLLPSARITFLDKTGDTVNVFQFSDGIRSWVRDMHWEHTTLHPIAYAADCIDGIQAEVALRYRWNDSYNVIGHSNGILTTEYSSEIVGFYTGLIAGINECAETLGVKITAQQNVKEGDIAEALGGGYFYADSEKGISDKQVSKRILRQYGRGLTAVVSVWVPEPRYKNECGTMLDNSEVRLIISRLTRKAVIDSYCNSNSGVVRRLMDKRMQ